MTLVEAPILKRVVGCNVCGRPTGEFIAEGETPASPFCPDCQDLPKPWVVTHGATVTTEWDRDVRTNTDLGQYALTPEDMWPEPGPQRPAGVGRNAFHATFEDTPTFEDQDDELGEDVEPPIPGADPNTPRCPCGGATFSVSYEMEGKVLFTAYADENNAGDYCLWTGGGAGTAVMVDPANPTVTCESCGEEYYGYEDLEGDAIVPRKWRIRRAG